MMNDSDSEAKRQQNQFQEQILKMKAERTETQDDALSLASFSTDAPLSETASEFVGANEVQEAERKLKEKLALATVNKKVQPQVVDQESLLKTAASSGVDVRSAMGQRFSRSMSADKKAEFNKLSLDERKAARKRYAAVELQAYVMKKSKTETTASEARKDGEFRSLKWLIREEGLEDAIKYAESCIAKGPKWCQHDPHWDRLEFNVITNRKSELWRQEDTLTLEGSNAPPEAEIAVRASEDAAVAAAGDAATAAGAADAAAAAAATIAAAKAKPKGKAKTKGKGKGKKDDEPPVISAISKAQKTKTQYLTVTSGAVNLQSVIENNQAWSWFNTPTGTADLTAARNTVQEALDGSEFAQDFFTLQMKEVKTRHPDLEQNCAVLSQEFDEKLKRLAKETSRLVSMKMSRDRC